MPVPSVPPLADVAPPADPDPAAVYGFLFGGCCFVLFVATAVVALIILIRRRNHDPRPRGGAEITEEPR